MGTSLTCLRSGRAVRRGAAARLIIVVLCAATVASCNSELYTDLDQRQANEIVATLREHRIPAERSPVKGGRMSVSVDESRFAEAVQVLNDNGLPREEFKTLGEVFKKDGLISSPVEERAEMIFALSQELSKTVSEIDGVLSARVHLVLPENDPLRQQLVPSSASVFIRHRAGVAINELTPQIKMLVANGVAGLSYDKVSVTLIAVPERTPVRSEGEAEPGLKGWGQGIETTAAGWTLYGLAAAAATLVVALSVMLRRRKPRIYPLNADDVAK